MTIGARRPVSAARFKAALRAELVRTKLGRHRKRPLSKKFRVLYLVQGPRPAVLSKFYASLISPRSQLLFLAFAAPQPRQFGALEFPKSLLGDGRNLLYLAARAWERLLGYRYHYLIWLDDDIRMLRGDARSFERFLMHWQPALATPSEYAAHAFIPEFFQCSGAGDCSEAFATCHLDHNFIAFHAEVIETLWPLDTRWDKECWWTSQYRQTAEASLRFRGHVLLAKRFTVVNYDHRYEDIGRQWNVTEAFGQAVDQMRARLPANLRHCIRRVEDTPHGFPWGNALRKGSRQYDAWHLGMLQESCDSRWDDSLSPDG
ncbi:unnamed protein product [Polarella glacialis]|uniref:Uncharacterized protein n=1 Tax=Polarella glacialis TaxID=89957 RepID=A0A813LBD2_POLGL|nr:unnamed protein product [Polarella glacialis]